MKKCLLSLIMLVTIPGLCGCGSAGEVDTALGKAKREGKTVMLELGSEGCIPCEQMKPVMKRLSTDYRGKLEVLFIDVGKDRETSRRFRVVVIPTQVFLDRNGKEFQRHVGFFSYEEIQALLRQRGL